MIIHSVISSDVAQLNRWVLSLDLNVANVLAHLISSRSWFQLRVAKELKADSPCFVWTNDPTDLSGLLGLYSVNISAMYLGHRPLSDL